MINIQQQTFTDDIKNFIFDGFAEHDIETLGYRGTAKDQIAFTAGVNEEIVGAITVLTFHGCLWIKYFFVKQKYRKQGIGKQLIGEVMKFAEDTKSKFVFVETLSYQALEFYESLGFKLEFTRAGFKNGISFHYLRKYL